MECLPEDMEGRRLEGLAKFAMDHPDHPMVPLLLQQVRRAGLGEPEPETPVDIEGETRESAWDYWIRDCEEQVEARKRGSINLKRGMNRWDTTSSLELLQAMRRFEQTLAELGVRGIRVTPESRWTTVAKNVPNRYSLPAAKFTRSCKVHFTNLLRMYKVPRRNSKGEDALDLQVRQGLEELFQLSDENFPHLLRRKGHGGNENGNREENTNIPTKPFEQIDPRDKGFQIPAEKDSNKMPHGVLNDGSPPKVMPDHNINENTNGVDHDLRDGATAANDDPHEQELPPFHPQDQRADHTVIGNTNISPPNDALELDSDAESEMRWEAYRLSIRKQAREDGEPAVEIAKNDPATGKTGDLNQGDLKGKAVLKTYADMLCNSDSESKGEEALKSALPPYKDSNQAADALVHLEPDDRGRQLGVNRGGPSMQRARKDPGEEKKKQTKNFERELRDTFDGEKKQTKDLERELRGPFDEEKRKKKGFERELRDPFDVEKKPKKGFERKLRDPFAVEKKPNKGFERKLIDPFDGKKKQKKAFERTLRDPFDREKTLKKKPPPMDSSVTLKKWDTASTLELLVAMRTVAANAENRWEEIASLVANDGESDPIAHLNSCKEQYRSLLSIYKRESCRANAGHKLLPDEVYAELDKFVQLTPTTKVHNVLNQQIPRVGKITKAPQRVAVKPAFKTALIAKKKDVQEQLGISTSPELNKPNRGDAGENPEKSSFPKADLELQNPVRPDNNAIGNTNNSPLNDPVGSLDSVTETEMRCEESGKSTKKRSRNEEEEPYDEITRNVPPATRETGELRQGDLKGSGICTTDVDMLCESLVEPKGRETFQSAQPTCKDSNLAMDIDKASCKDSRVHLASNDRGKQLEVGKRGPSLQRIGREPGVGKEIQKKDFERRLRDPGEQERKLKNPPTQNTNATLRKWDTASTLKLLDAMVTVGVGAKADNRWDAIASLVANDGELDPIAHLNSCREQYRGLLSIYRRESCRANSGHKMLPDEMYAKLDKLVHMNPSSKAPNPKKREIIRVEKTSTTPAKVPAKPLGRPKKLSDEENRRKGKQKMGSKVDAKGKRLSHPDTQSVVQALIDLGNRGRGRDNRKDIHRKIPRDLEADDGGIGRGKHRRRVEEMASNSNEGTAKKTKAHLRLSRKHMGK